MTKEEAEAKVKAEIDATTASGIQVWFCPWIKSHCNVKCLCYVKPKVFGQKVGEKDNTPLYAYYAYEGYCNCFSLVGPQS